MSKQFELFATKQDWLSVIDGLESHLDLKYCETDLLDLPRPAVFSSLHALPRLGEASSDTAIANPQYMVLAKAEPINVLSIPQRGGGVKFDVSPNGNRNSIIIQPGGSWAEAAIVAGRVGTAMDTPKSHELYRHFGTVLRRHFIKVSTAVVGPEALELHHQGWRLTKSAWGNVEFDLRA